MSGRMLMNRLRAALIVLLIGVSSVAHTVTSPVYSVSVPAHIYLAELNKRLILPQLRIRIKGSGWRYLDSLSVDAGCNLSIQGTLTVSNRVRTQQIEACEMALFLPDYKLNNGWKISRIHWGGDIRAVNWISNPIHTEIPHMHLVLSAPARGSRSLVMRLVTMTGPKGQRWESSLEKPR